ncbi:MAG: extracellular solute-binding protein [Anaerolineales bacterium]|nr:extracellular solute-binding protein [Anaerolineales bacterium]
MKKSRLIFIFSLLLIASMMLAACGGSTEPAGDSSSAATNADTETAAATEAPAEEPTEAPMEETTTGDAIEIRWYVGLGAGTDEATIQAQEDVVAAYNASQDKIVLKLEIVDNASAYDVLNTQIAAGNAPDIVGPMGIRGRASFPGAWMDMNPLIAANNYDLSDFDPALVDFYVFEGEQLGIPFAVFPSFTFFNRDLFDEAGLPYPPQEYGVPYVDADGNEMDWNTETVRELAMLLTVDANGNDATSPDFDIENIVQFGYGNMWGDMRAIATLFGPGSLVDASGNAQFPDNWREAMHWYYTGMWEEGWYPNGVYGNSDILSAGNWFESGNLAMANVHLWYAACCVGALESQWDAAAVPSYNGVTTAKLHADTFGIMKTSQHPQEAFEVLTYLLGEKAGELAAIYGGMPARLSLQDSYFDDLRTKSFGATSGADINWDVVRASLSYPDNPSHEEGLPSFLEASDRYAQLSQLMDQNPGLDLDAEIDTLVKDLQAIYDAAK